MTSVLRINVSAALITHDVNIRMHTHQTDTVLKCSGMQQTIRNGLRRNAFLDLYAWIEEQSRLAGTVNVLLIAHNGFGGDFHWLKQKFKAAGYPVPKIPNHWRWFDSRRLAFLHKDQLPFRNRKLVCSSEPCIICDDCHIKNVQDVCL